MIAMLTGLVEATGEDWVIIDVGGVGYEVFCASRTLANLPTRGEAVRLDIATHVREDMIRLYGFASPDERTWFHLLQSVQGVGAKVALAVLSTLTLAELSQAVAAQDKTTISRAPGVGPKVAQRIATELKDKGVGLGGGSGAPGDEIAPDSQVGDAVSALVNLGYGRADATRAITNVAGQAGQSARAEDLIRLALRDLAR
ncbi:MAG: Holliday junction branch migration protein RuvA [Alphaproteobacteria bacterium]